MLEAAVSTLVVLLITAAVGLSAYVLFSSMDNVTFRIWRWRRRRKFWQDFYTGHIDKRLTMDRTRRRK